MNSAQSEMVMDLLNELNKNRQTIVLVTHDVKVAVRGSRVIYIEDGHIVGELEFTPDGLYPKERREDTLMSFLQQRGW